MTRLAALERVVAAYPGEPTVVTLGATARELAAVARADNHLYVLDSMGLPPAIGLGLSLALESSTFDKCLVVEGDGSLLMGLSTLATIGLTQPKKLLLIVLDNGTYAATGGQKTAASAVDFAAVARGCSIDATSVDEEVALDRELRRCRSVEGPHVLHVRIGPENAKVPYVLEDPVVLGETFRRYVHDRADVPTETASTTKGQGSHGSARRSESEPDRHESAL